MRSGKITLLPIMPDSQTKQSLTQSRLAQIEKAFHSGSYNHLRSMLSSLPAADVAHLLESAPPKSRRILWQLVDLEREGEVLQELHDDLRPQFLQGMKTDELVAIAEGLSEDDDIADILQSLPEEIVQEVLQSMSAQVRNRLEKVLKFPPDTAGGLMNTDTITVRAGHTVEVVLRYLRMHESLPEMIDNLIVVNRHDQFLGLLPLKKILTCDPSVSVRQLMNTEVQPIQADVPDTEVAALFESHHWVSAPIVDADNHLLGRITVDDIVELIRDNADRSMLNMAGLDEEADTFAPMQLALPRRLVWLSINLITAVIASQVIGLFEHTLDKVVVLAILMPIVASMGGVAGIQTLTVVIRGMALNQIGKANTYWLLQRELLLAFVNGLLVASVIALIAGLWFHDLYISIIIGTATIINLITAAASGTLLPLIMKRMNIDPAIAGGVILTTITDVIGFFSFLGLATLFYL